MAGRRRLYYLVCPAGIPNYGDELIASTWLRHLARVAPDADVVVDCLGAAGAEAALGTLHPRARFVSALWELCTRNWSDDGPATCESVVAAVTGPATPGDLAEPLELLRRADVVHVLGGGFVNSVWPAFAGLFAGVAAAVRTPGSPGRAVLTGQGLWPAAPADLVLGAAEAFEVLDVRDAPSAEFLASGAGGERVSLSADDVFLGLGPHLYQGSGSPDVPRVMLSVQSLLAGTGPDELVQDIVELLAEWDVPVSDGIGLLECAPGQDAEALACAAKALPGVRLFPLAEVMASGLPAAPGQVWISTRFHPHLVAAAAGASGVALSIQPDYYATKHQSLVDGGSAWEVVDRLKGSELPSAGGFGAVELERLRAAKLRVAERIYGA